MTSDHSGTLCWKLKMPQFLFRMGLYLKLHQGNGPTPGNFFACKWWARAREELLLVQPLVHPGKENEAKSWFYVVVSFLLLPTSLSGCWFSLLASDCLLGTDSVQSLGGSSASLFHLRSKYSPSPPAVLSHYFGIKDSLFCKRKRVSEGHFSMLCQTQHLYRYACKQKKQRRSQQGWGGSRTKAQTSERI